MSLLFCVSRNNAVCAHEPACAVDGSGVVHAVDTRDALRWAKTAPSRRRATCDTVCGTRGRPWLIRNPEDPQIAAPWPPDVAGLRDLGRTRCRACYEATGRRRPITRRAHPGGKP